MQLFSRAAMMYELLEYFGTEHAEKRTQAHLITLSVIWVY